MIQSVTILAIVEILERFAYYGLRSCLILFLSSTLDWSSVDAVTTYGLFTGIVLIGPVFAGLISDLTGRPVLISIIGCGLFVFGSFGLSVSSADYLVKLCLIIIAIGSSCYKPAIISALFRVSAPKKEYFDLIYGIFYFCINIGSFAAPVIIGYCCNSENPETFRMGFVICGAMAVIPVLLLTVFYKRLTINDKIYNTEPYTLTGNGVGTIIILFVTTIVFWVGFGMVQQRIVDYSSSGTLNYLSIGSIIAAVLVVPFSLFLKFRTAYKISGGVVLVAILSFIVPVIGGFFGSIFVLSIAELLIAPMLYVHIIKTGAPRFTATLVGGMMLMSYLSNKLMSAFTPESTETEIGLGMLLGFLLLILGAAIFMLDYLRPRSYDLM